MRAKDGVPLSFTLITQAGFAIRENVSQAIQKQLKDVGVDMKVKLMDGTSISGVWFAGNFEAMLHWWQMGADPEMTLFFASDRVPPAGRNINYYRDEESDEAPLRVGSNGRPGEATRPPEPGAEAHCRPSGRDPAVQHVEDRRGAGDAEEFQGQSDERRSVLERARMGGLDLETVIGGFDAASGGLLFSPPHVSNGLDKGVRDCI